MRLAISALLVCVTGCTVTPDPATPSAAAPGERRETALTRHAPHGKHLSRRPPLSRASRSLRRSPVANFPALADCESGGNPRAVDPSGTYFGLYQFDLTTWANVGGHGNPADASPAEQTYRAELLYRLAGSSPWPVCGRYLRTAS